MIWMTVNRDKPVSLSLKESTETVLFVEEETDQGVCQSLAEDWKILCFEDMMCFI